MDESEFLAVRRPRPRLIVGAGCDGRETRRVHTLYINPARPITIGSECDARAIRGPDRTKALTLGNLTFEHLTRRVENPDIFFRLTTLAESHASTVRGDSSRGKGDGFGSQWRGLSAPIHPNQSK